ncbi:DoxX family membrane protein [Streptomyces sp. SID5468]|nr:DoxX family membrane protein [Streptomyces sp. SID5468]
MDTRTPRSSTGGRSPGFDEDVLNTVRVPSDPAQVIVNHASFRVKLGANAPGPRHDVADTAPLPVIPTSVRSAAEARLPRRRAAPVVWTGHTDPGDPAATQLLQAVRSAGSTQLLPRVDERLREGRPAEEPDDGLPPVRPAVVAPRLPVVGGPLPPLAGARRVRRPADDEDTSEIAYRPPHGLPGQSRPAPSESYPRHPGGPDDADVYEDEYGDPGARRGRRRGEPVRHAWYPGRRMNLGVVLLPLRVFLGCISVYAGLGKLCDPVYFDGGKRGSMVHWLAALHPWSVAEPLRATALAHPVGAGLTVAFLQVTVGVLTVMGLWQRVAAGVGALLSVALLVTVSWQTVPVYDAPDFIYLAAWSPLLIAGAPVYSVDAKLAGEAWRRLGPRAPLWELRRYVLRRGVVLATLVAGGALLVGALFGSAVRSSKTHLDTPAPPSDLPTNNLPGSPLPQIGGTGHLGPRHQRLPGATGRSARPGSSPGARPHTSATAGAPGSVRPGGVVGAPGGYGTGHHAPSHQGTAGRPAPASRPAAPAPHSVNPANPGPSGSGSSTGGSLGGLLGSKSSSGWLLGMPGAHRATPPGLA